MKNILVTGGAGFIGSNFIRLLIQETEYKVVSYDALTYAGNLMNFEDVKDNPRYTFVKGNICDNNLVRETLVKYDIDTIINFAAESHVDLSITNPTLFFESNTLGTQILLDAAKDYWSLEPDNKYCSDYKDGVKFVQVSTDEVYGTLGKEGFFGETNTLSPNSPYSASKASADLAVRAYNVTYGLPVNITRCANNYGPFQFPEKLIPLVISNSRQNKPLPIYGDGQQVREWIHVLDHCRGILTVAQQGDSKKGEIYNIGSNKEKTNLELVKLILHLLDKPETLITYVKDRPGHDRRYALDSTKIKKELDWQPLYSFEEGIRQTVNWYLTHDEWLKNVTSGAYRKYYKDMYTGIDL